MNDPGRGDSIMAWYEEVGYIFFVKKTGVIKTIFIREF